MGKNIIGNIFWALLFTIVSISISGNYILYDNAIIFGEIFIVLCFIQWFINMMIPIKITKESDELAHPVTQIENTLHIVNIKKHYGKKFNLNFVEQCNCGSTLFRIYNEDTEKGTYIQYICVKCNMKATGYEFNWKKQENLAKIIENKEQK